MACDVGSRWRSFAFTELDVGKTLMVHGPSGGTYSLQVDGETRTEVLDSETSRSQSYLGCYRDVSYDRDLAFRATGAVKSPVSCLRLCAQFSYFVIQNGNQCFCDNSNRTPNTTYMKTPDSECNKGSMPPYLGGSGRNAVFRVTAGASLLTRSNQVICSVEPKLGGGIVLSQSCSNLTAAGVLLNPLVSFASVPSDGVAFSNADAQFSSVAGLANALELDALHVACPNPKLRYVLVNSQYHIHDSRPAMLENTLNHPSNHTARSFSFCPSVPETFVNKHTCIRQQTCSPLTFSHAPLVLNATSIRQFYTASKKYVYSVAGLRLETPYTSSPCHSWKVSRWCKKSCTGFTASSLDADAITAITNAFAATSDTNPTFKDLKVPACSAPLGAKLNLNGECWEHCHPDTGSVYDFTYWNLNHDGNDAAAAASKPQPIARFALNGGTELYFPASHTMSRWSDRKRHFTYLGRLGDTLDFQYLPTEVQTVEMAALHNAIGTRLDSGFEACGSPGEVANDPTLGHRFQIYLSDANRGANGLRGYANFSYVIRNTKRIVWTNVALAAPDQLRQRIAWALSQIYVVGEDGGPDGDRSEVYAAYYDIFVRHAFGNLQDILSEVSYSPAMGTYLTFLKSKGLAAAGTFPDENYAREIMQLFTVGLYQLKPDGTFIKDADGNRVPNYDNDDIMSFARVWTGFDRQSFRGNLEARSGKDSANEIDPMQLKAEWRDAYPKSNLDDGFLGDRYPLCVGLPARHFLAKGARYKYVGLQSGLSTSWDSKPEWRFAPANTSALFQKLCQPQSNGECYLPREVVLDAALACEAGTAECEVDTVHMVRIRDGGRQGRDQYYQYMEPACVELTFFPKGREIRDLDKANWRNVQCGNPLRAMGMPGCCHKSYKYQGVDFTKMTSNIEPFANVVGSSCKYMGERTTYATTQMRCSNNGQDTRMCGRVESWQTGQCGGGKKMLFWTDVSCNVQAEIDDRGFVNVVYAGAAAPFDPNSGHRFQIKWARGQYPKASANCGAVCKQTSTMTCICNTTVTTTSVYTSLKEVPSSRQMLQELYIGAPDPSIFPAETYKKSYTKGDVEVYTKAPEHRIDNATIFRATRSLDTEVGFLANQVSTVSVADGAYSFRNPPHFMSFLETRYSPQAAEHETAALLRHLLHHNSTAPYVCRILIQRLTSSNPSPGYLQRVVEAFRTGSYAGTKHSGRYGDLAATTMAILLDPEARSEALEADPYHGKLREPIVKLLHFLRAMEFQSNAGRQVELWDLQTKIGQAFKPHLTPFQPHCNPI